MVNQNKLHCYRMVRNYICAEKALAEHGDNREKIGTEDDYAEAFELMLGVLTKYRAYIIEDEK